MSEVTFYTDNYNDHQLEALIEEIRTKKIQKITIYTTLPGIFTTSQNEAPNALQIKLLDYLEALEIISAGITPIPLSIVQEAKKKNIPINVISKSYPNNEGTVISDRSESDFPTVKAIAIKGETTVVSISTAGMWHKVGYLADVFSIFKKLGISIDQISTSESNITLTLDQFTKTSIETIKQLEEELQAYGVVTIQTGKTNISLIGNRIKSTLHKVASIFELFVEQKMYMISHSASDINISIVVDSEQAKRTLKDLHNILFKTDHTGPIFGVSLNELNSESNDNDENYDFWWKDKREQLLNISDKNEGAVYVYDLDTIKQKINNLKDLSNIRKVLYAVKANNNSTILKEIEKSGHGFECVSIEEVNYILSLFPSIDKKRILFTPNFSPVQEYIKALNLSVNVTLDSTYPLETWPEVFKDKEIFVRIDTGIGKGHHHYVNTAGNESKFGVPASEIKHLLELVLKNNTKIIGLHAHSGSGILTSESWSRVADYLFSILPLFKDVKIIDLGGGLGIPEKIGQTRLNLKAVNHSLTPFIKRYPNLSLWMEPGRYFVAEAGVLISKVTQIKRKGNIFYIGTNAGMNALIRPALYGSHHEIRNLTKLSDENNIIANIVGPICESGDVLGYARKLPASTQTGDVLLIATAGAYGRAMSSNYTMRPLPKEVVIF